MREKKAHPRKCEREDVRLLDGEKKKSTWGGGKDGRKKSFLRCRRKGCEENVLNNPKGCGEEAGSTKRRGVSATERRRPISLLRENRVG